MHFLTMRARSLALVLLSAVVIALFTGIAPARAHAVLTETSPEAGTLLTKAPDVARLFFNESVSPLAIRLVAPGGEDVDLTATVAAGTELVIPLGPLMEGTQVLSWRVVSDDGHPIAGSLVFSIGAITGAAEQSANDPWVSALLWSAKLAMSAGLILGVGGTLFGALAGLPPAASRPLRHLLAVGLFATALALGLHGMDALGLSIAGILDPASWRASAGTSFGLLCLLAFSAGLLALAALSTPPLAWLAVALLAASYASSGHASAAAPQWLTRPAVFLHLAMLCFWLGALLPLWLWLRRPDGTAALRRFSDLIPYAVLLLAASGIALMVVQFGNGMSGWTTAYGRILTVKLVLVAMLLGLAAWNRWKLTVPATEGEPRAMRLLRSAIIVEMALVLAILGLAAGWRFTPPPRALAVAEAAARPAYAHLHGENAMVDLTIAPPRAGPVSIEILPMDANMQAITPQSVMVGLALPDRGIESLSFEATVDPDGLWHVDGAVLPLPGTWQVDLDIRISRFAQTRVTGEISIE